jgi:hypothetical protein
MPLMAAHEHVEALTGRLDIIDCVVDELGVDRSGEVGELPLVFDTQTLRQGFQALGLAGEIEATSTPLMSIRVEGAPGAFETF